MVAQMLTSRRRTDVPLQTRVPVQLRHLQHQRRYWLVSSRASQHSSSRKPVTWRSLSDRPCHNVAGPLSHGDRGASRETPHTSYRVLPSKSSAHTVLAVFKSPVPYWRVLAVTGRRTQAAERSLGVSSAPEPSWLPLAKSGEA